MAQIKDDTPLARLEHVGVDVAIRIQHRDVGGVDMGMDVARLRLLQDEFFIARSGGRGWKSYITCLPQSAAALID